MINSLRDLTDGSEWRVPEGWRSRCNLNVREDVLVLVPADDTPSVVAVAPGKRGCRPKAFLVKGW